MALALWTDETPPVRTKPHITAERHIIFVNKYNESRIVLSAEYDTQEDIFWFVKHVGEQMKRRMI